MSDEAYEVKRYIVNGSGRLEEYEVEDEHHNHRLKICGSYVNYDDYVVLENNCENLEQAIAEIDFQRKASALNAARYAVVRTHCADLTPEEMDAGADAIIAGIASRLSKP